MPLPRYQPVKKKLKATSPSLDDLDDNCTSKIIAYALIQAKFRDHPPYTGDNMTTERNLSLVCKRWYFLTQTQIGVHGVHKIDLEEALKRPSSKQQLKVANKSNIRMNGAITAVRTPRRMLSSSTTTTTAASGARTPIISGGNTNRPRVPNYGILAQRNMTAFNYVSLTKKRKPEPEPRPDFSIKLFKALQFKLLKYKHIQLTGTVTCDNFSKLLIMLNACRIERLDIFKMRVEGARAYLNNYFMQTKTLYPNEPTYEQLEHLEVLTITLSTDFKDDPTNALLWTIYQRAYNIKELRVYLNESSCGTEQELNYYEDSANEMGGSVTTTAAASFIKRLTLLPLASSHPHLMKLVFDRVLPSTSGNNQSPTATTALDGKSIVCHYETLLKKVISEEPSIDCLETNDCSLVEFLVQTSNRLSTLRKVASLTLSSPIKNLELFRHLIRLHNLGTNYLSISSDNFDQIGEIRAILENFKHHRRKTARCLLNWHLRDQKYSDCEDKVKNLIQICHLADVNVYFSALQRISIDCCHLMWSTGRALQSSACYTDQAPGKCIFKITLQTYPIKPNTINPFEITVPLGKCPQYQISSTREDIARHREIMKSLKRDCYHQFVKSVRENNTP